VEPKEVATVMMFLPADDAGFITGALVSVDGGGEAWFSSH
jgi:NAD(P)-dependent dehydrogenase (short-subunit alcohol dehydrogenase family)